MGLFSDWEVEKKIGLGEILTILSVVGSVALSFGYVMYGQDKRIERNTFVNEQQDSRINGITQQMESNRLEQKQDIKDLGKDLSGQISELKNILIQQQGK